MHEVRLWGQNGGGGYFRVVVDDNGNVGIPAGKEAYLRLARYAPDELVAQALEALEAYRDRKKASAEAGGGGES